MILYKKIIIAVPLFCLMILIESCSSSVLVDVWNDPSYHEAPLKNILIIAIRRDPVQRRIWEDTFVDEFSKQGVKATSSYHLLPDALPDTDQVVKTIQDNGFDGVLVTHILLAKSETHSRPSYVTSDLKLRYNRFSNVYSSYYEEVQHPAFVDSLIIKRSTIDVWVVRDGGQMIWGATSNTPELSSMQNVKSDVANLVIAELVQDAIIEAKK